MTWNAALQDARPDAFRVCWAVVHAGRITAQCLEYPDGIREHPYRWMAPQVHGRTLPERHTTRHIGLPASTPGTPGETPQAPLLTAR